MPVMMRGMDRRICGSIPGRGAIDGVKIIKKWMKVTKETRYCLECDIHHFYDSLDPRVVMDRMRHLIKDPKVLDLIWRIVKDGIKIGFYTSQWFGNTVLQPLDQALRDAGVKCYVRYMDNFTLFAGRKRTLTNALKIIESWLNAHGMRLKDNHQIFKIKSKMKKVYGKEGLTRIRERLPNAMGYRFGRGFTIIRKHGLFTIKRNVASF
jgi:retron-type reverse transcriptase